MADTQTDVSDENEDTPAPPNLSQMLVRCMGTDLMLSRSFRGKEDFYVVTSQGELRKPTGEREMTLMIYDIVGDDWETRRILDVEWPATPDAIRFAFFTAARLNAGRSPEEKYEVDVDLDYSEESWASKGSHHRDKVRFVKAGDRADGAEGDADEVQVTVQLRQYTADKTH